jgi:pyruvate formate-lyase activating enzyme-like uncharacterized protein
MPREKQAKSCEHCGKEFIQARKDQKYCNPQCRFDHFFDERDNEKAVMENENEVLKRENVTLEARVKELDALQAVPAPALKPKRERLKAPTP